MTTKTATQVYNDYRDDIDSKIELLQQTLVEMDMRQETNSKDWGFAGNAGHINEILGQIIEQFVEEE